MVYKCDNSFVGILYFDRKTWIASLTEDIADFRERSNNFHLNLNYDGKIQEMLIYSDARMNCLQHEFNAGKYALTLAKPRPRV